VEFMDAPGAGVRRSARSVAGGGSLATARAGPDAGCLSLLKRCEPGWHRAARSAFSESDVALWPLTSGNGW
jgi:hypothetical protein